MLRAVTCYQLNVQKMGAVAWRGVQVLKRRVFIVLLGGAAATMPFAGHTQQTDRVRQIGVLMGFAENDEVWQAYLAAFRQRLKDFGWIDEHNLRIEYRF